MQKSWAMEIGFAYKAVDVPMAGGRRRGDAWIRASVPVLFTGVEEDGFKPALTATDHLGGRVSYRTDGRYLYAPIAHPVLNPKAFEAGYAAPPVGEAQVAISIEDGLVRLDTNFASAEAAASQANKQNKPWEAREGVADPAARQAAETKLRASAEQFKLFDDMLWQPVAPPQWAFSTDPEQMDDTVPFLHLPELGHPSQLLEHRLQPYRHEEAAFDDLGSALIKSEMLNGHPTRYYGELEIHDGIPAATPEQLQAMLSIREAMLAAAVGKMINDSNLSRDIGKMDRPALMAWADLRDAVAAINETIGVPLSGRFFVPRDLEDERVGAMATLTANHPEMVPELIHSLEAFARPLMMTEKGWSNIRYDLTQALGLAGMAKGARAWLEGLDMQQPLPTP